MPVEKDKNHNLTSRFIRRFHKVNNELPSVLYHYTRLTNQISIKSSQQFWFTKFDESIKDRFELRQGLNISSEILSLINSYKKFKFVFDKYQTFLKDEIKEPALCFYMGCFCVESSSEYLLDNFSVDNKSPILFCWDNQKSFNIDTRDLAAAHSSVCYDEKLFRKNVRSVFLDYGHYVLNHFKNWIQKDIYDEKMKEAFISLHRDIYICCVFYKPLRFEDEKEYRIVVMQKDCGNYYKLPLSEAVLGT